MANDTIKHLMECGTLNRVFAAYFINQCMMKHEINLNDYKATMPNIADLSKDGFYFSETDHAHGLKHFFNGRVVIENIDLEHFRSVGIYDFFDDSIKNKILDVVRYFHNAVKAYEYCDVVFSDLPDASPMIYDCIRDPESGFRSRLIIGADFGSGSYTAIWDFNALLMDRLREVESHPIYGKKFMNVNQMTDQEREQFNKPQETKDEIGT